MIPASSLDVVGAVQLFIEMPLYGGEARVLGVQDEVELLVVDGLGDVDATRVGVGRVNNVYRARVGHVAGVLVKGDCDGGGVSLREDETGEVRQPLT